MIAFDVFLTLLQSRSKKEYEGIQHQIVNLIYGIYYGNLIYATYCYIPMYCINRIPDKNSVSQIYRQNTSQM